MTPEFALKKFKEQIDSIDTTEFRLWLDTTYTYVEDYFSLLSNQSMNFKSLIGDVNIYYAGFPFLQDPKKEKAFKDRAIGYLKSYMTYIEEKEKESAKMQSEILKTISITKDQSHAMKAPSNSSKSTLPETKSKDNSNEKSNFHLNISKEFFWILSSSIVVGAFFLGFYIGQAKFDKEKIEYYEQNKALNKDVTTFKIEIDTLTKHNLDLLKKNKELDENYKSALNNFSEYYYKYQDLINKK